MKKVLFVAVCAAWLGFACSTSKVKVDELRVELRENPVGVGTAHPRFMWQIESEKSNVNQVAYQIQVAASAQELEKGKNLLWDSGFVNSDTSLFIAYGGSPLQSATEYFWRVRVKTNKGRTAWSETENFATALLDSAAWKAEWIGIAGATNPGEELGDSTSKKGILTRLAARYLRKEFPVKEGVKRAVLYICPGGSAKSYLNGEQITEDVFESMPTHAPATMYYNSYDVTKLLGLGNNTIGVILGNGRFFPMRNPGIRGFGVPRLLAQLEIEYKDGTKELVVTDTTWQATARGPIVANNEFDGEEYNAFNELPGWNKTGYETNYKWMATQKLPAPGGKLVAQPNENIRIMEEIKPVAIMERPNGNYILDMGQNMVGWLHVKLKGQIKKPITFRFAETLQPDGSLFTANLRSAKATDTYIPAWDAEFEWEPNFTYHGFRYVEISGLSYKPALHVFTGKVIYDKMETTGEFETSNPVINQIYKNAYWGIRGNYRGMPTDCPQRDERLGWLGDRTTGALGESFIFDNALLYKKWLQDIYDSRDAQGRISDVSPRTWTVYGDDVTWPAAYFYVADMLYRQFGDKSGIETHYQAMRKWMHYMQQNCMEDNVIITDRYGDWCMPPESPELIHSKDPSRKTRPEILGTTVYYSLLQMMSQFAQLTGNEADVAEYQALAAKMKESYNKKFFNYETAQYGNNGMKSSGKGLAPVLTPQFGDNTVTGNILSLRLGLVPEGYEGKVFQNIVDKTVGEFDGHVSVGVLGIQHLMRGLTEHGAQDLAYKIATNETYPSWGYMAKKGATTIWELWNGDTGAPNMNSGNHVMLLGDLVIWFYEDLAGIRNDPQSAGFKKIQMEPVFIDGLDYVKASYKSVSGEIKSHWKREDGNIEWKVTIPANTSATVKLAGISGVDFKKDAGASEIKTADGATTMNLCSGEYEMILKK